AKAIDRPMRVAGVRTWVMATLSRRRDDATSAGTTQCCSAVSGSERVAVHLAGADPHHAFEIVDEHLAVADLAGAGRLEHCLADRVGLVVGDRDLELDLGQEV